MLAQMFCWDIVTHTNSRHSSAQPAEVLSVRSENTCVDVDGKLLQPVRKVNDDQENTLKS